MLVPSLILEVKKNGTLAVEGSPAQGTYIVDHSVRRLPRGAWGVDPGGVRVCKLARLRMG